MIEKPSGLCVGGIGSVIGLTVALAILPLPAAAEEAEQRVVKKVEIRCDGEDCAERQRLHELHGELGEHELAWVESEGPGHYFFRTHMGGGFLGVQLAELTPELRTHFGVAESAGVMVSKVVEGGPAARAGVQVGDIITALDTESVDSGRALAGKVRGKKDGETVLLEIWRDRSVQNLSVAVEERETGSIGGRHAFFMKCEDGEADCSFGRGFGNLEHGLDCGDDPCEVQVQCDDAGDCECTVNGEAADCQALDIRHE